MREITESLRKYAEKRILPLYENCDAAHGPEHIRTVIENSMELAENLLAENVDVDIDMVFAVAVYHDVGVRFGRKDHEETSAKWLREDEALKRWFTEEQIRIMSEAVEDHRASRQEPPRNLYGRIVSEADRDLEPERIVRRCIKYGVEYFPEMNEEEQIDRSAAHIREKYGEGGYLHLWLPCPKNERGLATLQDWLKTGEIRDKCRAALREIAAEKGER